MKLILASLLLVCIVYSVQASWVQDYYINKAMSEEEQLVVCIAEKYTDKGCACLEHAKVCGTVCMYMYMCPYRAYNCKLYCTYMYMYMYQLQRTFYINTCTCTCNFLLLLLLLILFVGYFFRGVLQGC